MSLDVKRLAKVRELANGVVQAQCPACAEGGGDRKGEHLRVYPDGRYGCCVHPKDREHRRRIHALAGNNTRRVIKVRVAAAKSGGEVLGGILGRLGRVFQSPNRVVADRTPRTGYRKSNRERLRKLGRFGRGTVSPTRVPWILRTILGRYGRP